MSKVAQKEPLVALSNATLSELPEGVLRPSYKRSDLTAGIVHIGLGNFHRAHQAWYLHRLMQTGQAMDWAIIGAGVRPNDSAMRDKLLRQDCLTTLVELDPSGTSAEVIGSMIDFLPVDPDNASLIQAMSDPAIRIVSLTVTEGGYYIDPVSGEFDLSHPDLQHDIANPGQPRTAFGAMVAALKNRRGAGEKPFTGQSCDNLQGNGAILRRAIVSLAEAQDPQLGAWIDTHGAFPDSMVDCIVPATGEKEIALVADLGLVDAAPVTHENFRQWVIEDDFVDGRPDWDAVGATFTDTVHVFEAMKIRLLNGGHQVIANVGEILSIETISGCMADPDVLAFFRKVLASDIAPHVASVPGYTPQQYIDLIERRFANPSILDTTRRVAFDGSARHTGFILPVLREAVASGGSYEGLALTEALWARMCTGTREDGSTIAPNDPFWDDLVAASLAAKARPIAWLEQSDLYGDLVNHQGFATAFAHWLQKIWSDGAAATLRSYVSS